MKLVTSFFVLLNFCCAGRLYCPMSKPHSRRIEALVRHLSEPEPYMKGKLFVICTASNNYESIIIKTEIIGSVAVITINRPRALNSLNNQV